MHQSLIQVVRRQPAWLILLVASLLLILVGYIDVATGPEMTFAHFYLVPVILVTWLLERRWGYVMAVASAAVCLTAEHLGAAVYQNPVYREWNFVTRLLFCIAAVWLLSSWQQIGSRLAEMVEKRTAALRDEIAQRKRAEADLRSLAAKLSAAEDAERRTLAYEIHDSLSQMLSLMKINLDAATLEAVDGSPLHQRLTDCVATAEDLIRQTRTLTFDLHPAMLDDLGLAATLQRFSRDYMQRLNVDVAITESGFRRTLDSPITNFVFRAIKELISNAVKHGRAKEIIVGLHWETGDLRVVVDDDGTGFDSHTALAPGSRRGLGLPGIDERLTSLGGKMDIESSAGHGSRIIFELPLGNAIQQELPNDYTSSAG